MLEDKDSENPLTNVESNALFAPNENKCIWMVLVHLEVKNSKNSTHNRSSKITLWDYENTSILIALWEQIYFDGIVTLGGQGFRKINGPSVKSDAIRFLLEPRGQYNQSPTGHFLPQKFLRNQIIWSDEQLKGCCQQKFSHMNLWINTISSNNFVFNWPLPQNFLRNQISWWAGCHGRRCQQEFCAFAVAVVNLERSEKDQNCNLQFP